MKTNKIIVIWACLLLSMTAAAQDKVNEFNAVEHAVISQTIAPDARSAGMGDVGAATDPDVNSQYWNPAKYPFCISRAGISLNYTPWLRKLVSDIDLAYVAGYYRIGDYSAVSGSLRYFSLGEVMTSLDDNAMTVKPYELSLDAAYSLMLSDHFSLAAGIRWIYSDLRYDYTEDASPASAFAADLAMYYNNYFVMGERECQLGLGLNFSNIGSKISYFGDDRSQFLPANMRLGASLMIPIDEYNRFSIAADANKLLVPTVPKQEEGEDNASYQQRVIEEYSDGRTERGRRLRTYIAEKLNEMRLRLDVSFVLQTLEYLHKGGRCSGVAALGANLLKLRPEIVVSNEGTMSVGRKYRGNMEKTVLDYIRGRLEGNDNVVPGRIMITHTDMPQEIVDKAYELVKSLHPFQEICITSAGSTIGSHCGPACIGVLFFRKTAK